MSLAGHNEASSLSVTIAVVPNQNKFGAGGFTTFLRPEFHKISFETSHLRA